MKRFLVNIIFAAVCLSGFGVNASAQFKEEAFTQTYTSDSTSFAVDTSISSKMFSFKELFRGTAHKSDIRASTLFGGSVIFPGIAQVYQREYWKLPVIYVGIGASTGLGVYYHNKYNRSVTAYEAAYALDPATTLTKDKGAKAASTCLFVSAGLFYWYSMFDGIYNYKRDLVPNPSKATIYSILLPGLGQAYNGEYWKIPIYWGCLIGSGHYYYTNNVNYKRFKRIHNETYQDGYSGPISQSTAEYYRDVYRRYRDYSAVAFIAFYLLQVIDANVFAYMYDFEVNDDISFRVEPAVISNDNAYAMTFGQGVTENAIGLRIGIRF